MSDSISFEIYTKEFIDGLVIRINTKTLKDTDYEVIPKLVDADYITDNGELSNEYFVAFD